jgi:hypothetical protein
MAIPELTLLSTVGVSQKIKESTFNPWKNLHAECHFGIESEGRIEGSARLFLSFKLMVDCLD